MTKKEDGRRSVTTKKGKRSPPPTRQRRDVPDVNGGLTEQQVLALWEMIITGDGKIASHRWVKLKPVDEQTLTKAGLITVEKGPRPKQPGYMAKLHMTDKGWAWANQQGLSVRVPSSKATALVLEALLDKLGAYLRVEKRGLHQILAPRPLDPEPAESTSTPPSKRSHPEVRGAGLTLEERIRTAYLHVTGGAMDQYVKLAHLRAALRDEPVEAVDEELRRMQQRGTTVLYPIDDPQRLRPEDDAAAMRVAGERRDLVCIKR